MLFFNFAIKVQRRLFKGNQPFFKMNVELQKNILFSFKEPKNLIERSYFQYLCQMKFLFWGVILIQNILSFLLLPLFLIKVFKRTKMMDEDKKDAAFITSTEDSFYIPKELEKEFGKIIFCGYNSKKELTYDDIRYIYMVFRKYWYKPFFILKCAVKISLYSGLINKNNPKAILTFTEYSFTSSLLTDYCNHRNVEHINLMHGEKLFYIRDSFVKFNRYYVWDKYYVDLLVGLRAEKNQFVIFNPFTQAENEKKDCKKEIYDFTYFLGGETLEEMITIKRNLLRLKKQGYKVAVRPHPRYSNMKQIKGIFNDLKVIDNMQTSIYSSIEKTKYVIGLYSTVLFQGYSYGKQVVIDDLVNLDKFIKLSDLKYIMIKKEHGLLSDFFEIKGDTP